MTGTSNVSNGNETTAKEAVQPEHGTSTLRKIEAKGLIALICDAIREVLGVTHEMHELIYGPAPKAKVSSENLLWMRQEALACLSTTEHYLLMLGSVLEDQTADDDLSEEQAPYPVYMVPSEATDGH